MSLLRDSMRRLVTEAKIELRYHQAEATKLERLISALSAQMGVDVPHSNGTTSTGRTKPVRGIKSKVFDWISNTDLEIFHAGIISDKLGFTTAQVMSALGALCGDGIIEETGEWCEPYLPLHRGEFPSRPLQGRYSVRRRSRYKLYRVVE